MSNDNESKRWRRKVRRVHPTFTDKKLLTEEDVYNLQMERAYQHHSRRTSSLSSVDSAELATIREAHDTDTEVPVEPTPEAQPDEATYEYYAGNGEGRWEHQDFALICFATVNNFSNIASFPALCRENGGIVFVLLYAFLEISLALPIIYLEMIIGQFSKSALVDVWRLCPLFKGIGFTLGILIFGFIMFFPVLVSWSLQYAVLAVTETFVWGVCHNVTEAQNWNTPQCREDEDTDIVNRSIVRATEEYYRIKIVGEKWEGDHGQGKPIYGPYNLGSPSGPAVAYIILIYILVLVVISFGPRVLGRAVHFTTAFPTLFLTILVFRGTSLSGAYNGLADLLRPDFAKFLHPTTWRFAITQVVSSTQCGQGYYTTYASYNQFRSPIFRYALLTICLDLVFCLLGGVTVFTFLGHSGYRRNKGLFNDTNLRKVSGETIMYELMPEAFTRIRRTGGGRGFAVIFFLMIFLNTVDNLALMIDILTTAVTEVFRKFFQKVAKARSVVLFLIILSSLIINIVFTTPGGVYLMTIVSSAFGGGGTNYLICCFLMLFGITCVFGESGLPFFGLLLFLEVIEDFFGESLQYRHVLIQGGKPAAIFLIYISLLPIPIAIAYVISRTPSKGSTSRLLQALRPEHEQVAGQGPPTDAKGFLSHCPCISWFNTDSFKNNFRRAYEKASEQRQMML